jgi:hypothetical protein
MIDASSRQVLTSGERGVGLFGLMFSSPVAQRIQGAADALTDDNRKIMRRSGAVEPSAKIATGVLSRRKWRCACSLSRAAGSRKF